VVVVGERLVDWKGGLRTQELSSTSGHPASLAPIYIPTTVGWLSHRVVTTHHPIPVSSTFNLVGDKTLQSIAGAAFYTIEILLAVEANDDSRILTSFSMCNE
jgi:hypothetical protein